MSFAKLAKTLLFALSVFGLLGNPRATFAQYNTWYTVDCSGNNPWAYPSINSVIPLLTDRSGVYIVPGTCTEDITLSNLNNIAIVTDSNQKVNVVGNFTIQSSRSIYLYGLNVSSPVADGLNILASIDITCVACSSSGNAGNGLAVGNGSQVSIQSFGSFNSNGGDGIRVDSSLIELSAFDGPIEARNNGNLGVELQGGRLLNYGNLIINNNQQGGVAVGSGSNAMLDAGLGPISINSNQGSGISLSHSQMIASVDPYSVTIQGNGQVGVDAEAGSLFSASGGVQILDHASTGIYVAGAQLALWAPNNQITHNGFGSDPLMAGIRLDIGSQAYIEQTTITQSSGPGILNLANSTLEVLGSTFTSNAGGPIRCDSTSVTLTDLPSSVLGAASACKTAPPSGALHGRSPKPSTANWKNEKAFVEKMQKMVAGLHH